MSERGQLCPRFITQWTNWHFAAAVKDTMAAGSGYVIWAGAPSIARQEPANYASNVRAPRFGFPAYFNLSP